MAIRLSSSSSSISEYTDSSNDYSDVEEMFSGGGRGEVLPYQFEPPRRQQQGSERMEIAGKLVPKQQPLPQPGLEILADEF